jgi:hypothetical protein
MVNISHSYLYTHIIKLILYIDLYDGNPCEGLADENILFTECHLNKNHLFKLQHYYRFELLANEIV